MKETNIVKLFKLLLKLVLMDKLALEQNNIVNF